MSTPHLPPTALEIAQTRASYTRNIDNIHTVVKNALPLLTAPNLEDLTKIFDAISIGPFRASTKLFQPHPFERPLNLVHVQKLLPVLASFEDRMNFPAHVFVSDDVFLQLFCPPNYNPITAEQCLLWSPPLSGTPFDPPIYLTHGHRFYALSQPFDPSAPSTVRLYADAIKAKYGEDLEWVVRFLPACKSIIM